MSENIQKPAPPVPPVTITQNNQQTAENPSGATIQKEEVTETVPEINAEAINEPQQEQSVSKS